MDVCKYKENCLAKNVRLEELTTKCAELEQKLAEANEEIKAANEIRASLGRVIESLEAENKHKQEGIK